MEAGSLDPNLLATGRRPKGAAADTAPAPAPSSRRKTILKGIAYVAIFFTAFLFFLLLKIPSGIVTNFVLQKINESGPYRVDARKVEMKLLMVPHLNFEGMQLSPRYPGAGMSFDLDKLELYPSFRMLGSLLTGAPAVKAGFVAEAYKANWSGSVSLGNDTDFGLDAENIDITKLTPLLEAGVELKGVIQKLAVDLAMTAQKISRANGEIRLSGTNFQVDPGAFQVPMPLPILDLGPVEIQGKLTNGRLVFQKAQVGAAGRDLELRLEGDIQIADTLPYSRMNLRLRIKPSEKLKKAVPTLEGMLGMVAAKRADGFFGTKLSGTFASPGLPTPDP